MRHVVILACALLGSMPLLAADPNLLVNPTFDNDVNGWQPQDVGASIAYSTLHADPLHPAGSGLVTNNSSGSAVRVAQCVDVIPGSTYLASGDVYIASGQAGSSPSATLRVEWYIDACRSDATGFFQLPYVQSQDAWQKQVATFVAPSNATKALFSLLTTTSAPSDSIDFQFDNLVFKRVPVRGDVNGDGVVDVADVFYLVNFLFAAGPPPPLP